MIPKTTYLPDRFLLDIFPKLIIQRDHGAGEHEILPYQNSKAITSIVKRIRRIDPSTPNA